MNEDLEFKDIDEDDEEEVKIPEIHGTKNYMTRACYNRLLDERKNLVLVERPNVVNVDCLGRLPTAIAAKTPTTSTANSVCVKSTAASAS